MQQELTDLGASSAHDKQAAAPQTNENALTLGGEVPARIDGQLPAPVNCKDCACHCEPEGRSRWPKVAASSWHSLLPHPSGSTRRQEPQHPPCGHALSHGALQVLQFSSR